MFKGVDTFKLTKSFKLQQNLPLWAKGLLGDYFANNNENQKRKFLGF